MIKLRGKSKIDEDLGFGKNPIINNQRLLNKDGSSNVRRKGLPFFKPHEVYNSLIFMKRSHFWMVIIVSYLTINFLFASIYFSLGMEHLQGANGKNDFELFFDAFFFSAQTISTVGYGHISPSGFATSIVAALESMLGLLAFALATGLLYGRFSRPTAKICYSEKMLVAPYKDGEGLMFRLANLRSNQLIELEITVMISINATENGKTIRRFAQLDLERKAINLLTLSWTVVHPITEDSPIYGLKLQDLIDGQAEFLVMLKAFDDAFAQTVQSRTSYKAEEVVYNAKFDTIIQPDEDGVFAIDMSKVSDYTVLTA
ncbi:ion channel [Pelobium sp.]|nr:ion channel [Pelobium sp.]MDA9555372.1 ion channel [Pelobium sp.]